MARRDLPTGTAVLERLAAHGISRSVLALCVLWLVAVGPIVADMSAQPAPRFALTGALVDDGAIIIDGYRLGVDKAERDGHLYSDKAPGQEVIAVPAYAAARAVGAEPARVDRVEGNLTLWWVTFWSATLPGVGIILLVAVAGHRRGTPVPVAALATLLFGTLLLPFSVNLYGHVLAALLGFAAWVVLDRRPSTTGRALAAGGLVGVAVLVEYQMAIVALALLGLLVVRRRWSGVIAFAAAGLPCAVALGAYQAAAFGSPWSSGYGGKDAHQGATLLVTGVPRPDNALSMLVGPRGLFLFTPVVLLALVGLVQRWRQTRDSGAAVGLVVAAGFLLLQAGWQNPYGGEMPGPRYVIPMLPFLGLGLGHIWLRTPPLLRRWVAGISVASMVIASAGDHLLGGSTPAVTGHLNQIAADGVNPVVWSLALGPVGWVLYAASVIGAIWLYRSTSAGERTVPVVGAEVASPTHSPVG